MNLLEKRLARLEKLGVSSPSRIKVLPASSAITPDEAAAPLQATGIHGTTGDYYFSGTLAPAVALSDEGSAPSQDGGAPPQEWHTTPRMVRVCARALCSCLDASPVVQLRQLHADDELEHKPARHVSLAAVPPPAAKTQALEHLSRKQRLRQTLLQRIKKMESRMEDRLHEA
jgi:hypothetical protein